jgi:hypothetical protein
MCLRLLRKVVEGGHASARCVVRSGKMLMRGGEQRPEDLRMLHFTDFVLARQKAGPDAVSQMIGSRPSVNMAVISESKNAICSCLECRAAPIRW